MKPIKTVICSVILLDGTEFQFDVDVSLESDMKDGHGPGAMYPGTAVI